MGILRISFAGILRNDLRGFYRIKTGNQPYSAATMFAVSNFEGQFTIQQNVFRLAMVR